MFALPAVVTQAQAPGVLRQLVQAWPTQGAPQGAPRLDASGVQQFDSSTLAVLLACAREAQRRGVVLAIEGLPQRLNTLAQVYGVAEFLGLSNST
jgi:phospholipid transport system transporter-binding protein